RCAVIPHLALPGPYDREAARVALGLPRDAFVILTAGFASRAKRLGWVAEAVAALAPRRPGLLWLHAGEWDKAVTGPPGPVVERLRAEGRLRVTGFLEESALGLHIAACDVLANLRAPSVGESSGTLARALAAGRCALVSDTGAYAELPRDAVLALPALAPQRAMVAALAALSRDPGLCDAIGERARLFARTVLSPDSVARAYRAVIEDFRAAPPPLAVPPGPAYPVPLR
ncbi:glycosyltransferase, partial [Roseomonas sp. TAS13]|uniref:glycosyltransferase n=1 Tax=Roseomonas sp. TAS13 TaxID=1926319 RepID=UPI000AA4C027